jgi:catecholate siderophore receptor
MPTASNNDGSFRFDLNPGQYTLRIFKSNFVDLSTEIKVGSQELTLNSLVLQVAPLKSTVQVTENTGYMIPASSSSTRTLTPLQDVPQTVNVVTQNQVQDQLMLSVGDVVRYVPGVSAHQGENNRDEIIIRGVDSSANFYLNGMRDDVQYYRDLYNIDRIEILKGSNELAFGRGGGGGVVNRITKEAGPNPSGEIVIEGGSFYNKRVALDLNRPLTDKLDFRINGVYENSDSFRYSVGLERYAVNPTITFNASDKTRVVVGFENLRDTRTADRGITSYLGSPANVPIETYYGNPADSHVRALLNIGSVLVEHQIGKLTIRNRSLLANYDRGYQNFVPGVATPDGQQVNLSAYNNATDRTNLLNQTDFIYTAETGPIRHTLLAGSDLGRQLTDNFRNTGYFNNTTTTILAPFTNPTITTPVTFRQSATDADNHLRTNIAAGFVQDQMELTKHLQLVGGVRFDHFDLQYHDNRLDRNLRRIDNLASPRAGLVYKPVAPVSLYLSYSVSYLPSSGDQFASLTNITQQLKPEKFANYEAGMKWTLLPTLSLNFDLYRLDRTNTRSIDPNNPLAIIQTGSQRSNGREVELTGSITRKWQIAGGYAYQDCFVTSSTASARQGAQVAQTPHHMFSLWNNYQFLPRLGAGVGLLNRSNMFAGIDNTVIIPSFFRADLALFYSINERIRIQANVENLFDRRYYVNADSNTNISPGFPRTIRVAMVYRF